MCVIGIKPVGVRVPLWDLNRMWSQNHDGAGLAYYENGQIAVRKGFMKLKHFRNELDDLIDKQVVFHLRFATHGLVNMYQTHPFALIEKPAKSKMMLLDTYIDSAVLFHNGVVTDLGDSKYSDTLELASTILSFIPSVDTRLRVLDMLGSNKFVLMQGGEIYKVGFFSKERQIEYSNVTWANTYTPTKHATTYGWRDDELLEMTEAEEELAISNLIGGHHKIRHFTPKPDSNVIVLGGAEKDVEIGEIGEEEEETLSKSYSSNSHNPSETTEEVQEAISREIMPINTWEEELEEESKYGTIKSSAPTGN